MAITNSISQYGVTYSPKAKPIVDRVTVDYFGVDYPIVGRTKDSTGRPKYTKIFSRVSGNKLSRNNISQFIKTDKGNRVMRPTYGTNLKQYLFNNMDVTLFSIIAEELMEDFSKHMPEMLVSEISISEPKSNIDLQQMVISLTIQDTLSNFEALDVRVALL